MLMELASHMVHHDNMCGPLLMLMMRHLILDFIMSTLAVHALIHPPPSMESFPALLVRTTTVKQAAEQMLNNVTTLMILSGMVRGVRGRMSAVTEEDRGSVSSCLNQLRMTLR